MIPCSLTDVPPEDPFVYDMICRADTVGVFQVESRAQMSMLPRLRPRCFYDLVIEVAIVRPGPIQGGMVHPYLRRRSGQEPITYPNKAIREVLHRTLGVPLFQEQAMRLAIVAADFTPGEADQLRRAMGAWRRHGDISRFRTKLIDGMKRNGLPEEFAERCFKQICGFGEYGFPESHAASFALLVYVSAWLKRYHPAAFCASILNSLPMGFYHPAQLVRDAREHGVTVLPIDVNYSGYDCRLEGTERHRDHDSVGTGSGTKGSDPSPERKRRVNQSRDREGAGECNGAQATSRTRRSAAMLDSSDSGQSRDREGAGECNGAQATSRTRRSAAMLDSSDSGQSRDCEEAAASRRLQSARTPEVEGRRDVGTKGQASRDADPSTWGVGGPAVRLGMRLIKGISAAAVEGIERAQRQRPFTSVADLYHRCGVAPSTLARLAAADAMRSLGLDRRQAVWKVLSIDEEPPMLEGTEPNEPNPKLPKMSTTETVFADYETIGLSLTAHPISLIRSELKRARVVQNKTLQHSPQGRWVRVAGLVVVRQRPATASGITFCTLEDETGTANLVIKPKVWDCFRVPARGSVAQIAEGRIERIGEVVHVNVARIESLSAYMRDLVTKSRNFH